MRARSPLKEGTVAFLGSRLNAKRESVAGLRKDKRISVALIVPRKRVSSVTGSLLLDGDHAILFTASFTDPEKRKPAAAVHLLVDLGLTLTLTLR